MHYGGMLIVHTKLERLLAVGIQRQEIGIALGAAMQNTPEVVHGGVDHGAVHATIFGLDVDDHSAERYV